MKNYRLNRLFNARSNRCFDVAIDHGFFNERGFLQGIENLEKSVKTLVAAAPDAIQLTVGQAGKSPDQLGREDFAINTAGVRALLMFHVRESRPTRASHKPSAYPKLG